MARATLRVATAAALVAVASGALLRVPLRKTAPNVAGHLDAPSPAPLLGAGVDATTHAVTLSNFMDAQVRRVRGPRLPAVLRSQPQPTTRNACDGGAGSRVSSLRPCRDCAVVSSPVPPRLDATCRTLY